MNIYIQGKTSAKDLLPVDNVEDEILVSLLMKGKKIQRRKEKGENCIINGFKGPKIVSF